MSNFVTCSSILLVLMLCGCSGDDDSVEGYVNKIKNETSQSIEQLPENKVYQPFEYSATDLRDPFSLITAVAIEPETPAKKVEEDLAARQQAAAILDLARTKELLESFPLDSLTLVGTLEKDEQTWGLIKDTAGTVHRVRAGNYLGMNHGLIKEITPNSIYIEEKYQTNTGVWEKRGTTLDLTTR